MKSVKFDAKPMESTVRAQGFDGQEDVFDLRWKKLSGFF
jgi:hypothetical protein